MNEELDLSIIKKLEKVRIYAKKLKLTGTIGERKSPKMGRGSEFADYRSYELGDEVKYIDWNVYARLEKFLIKLFEEEEDLNIHILLDSSSSMGFGNPSKLFYGKNLALAFAYLGLNSWEKVKFAFFHEDIQGLLSLERRRENIFHLYNILKPLKAYGLTDLNKVLKRYLEWQKTRGILILLSDLFSPFGFKEGLALAKYKKFSIYLVQILSEEELEPPYMGDLWLIDSETKEKKEIFVDREIKENYKKELNNFFKDLEKFTLSYGIEYLRTTTSIPLEDLLLKYLRASGWLT